MFLWPLSAMQDKEPDKAPDPNVRGFGRHLGRMQAIHQRPYVPSRLAVSSADRPLPEGQNKALLGGSNVFATKNLYLPWVLFIVTLTFLLVYSSKVQTACEPIQKMPGEDQLSTPSSPLGFMRGRHVLLVSHELSLSGGPLLLMELATLLKNVGTEVHWVTNQKDGRGSELTRLLEARLKDKKVKILGSRDPSAVKSALQADIVILNTAVAGKWIDSALHDNLDDVLPKVLWWIHEMRGHYFSHDLVKHLPRVAGAIIDSHATAEYWRNRTATELRLKMPRTYVVHLGNSKELTEAAESEVGRKLLRQHVREHYGMQNDDVVFSMINSFSRGKGQDLFLSAFVEALQMRVTNADTRSTPGQMHAFLVGSDWAASQKYEAELIDLVKREGLEHLVHFVNKTLHVAPFLAASDVLVQNSQNRGECFGRITIEAMAFALPILGTAAGGTKEIVVNRLTGLLHPVGKAGIPVLAEHMATLYMDAELRESLGQNGKNRVSERFMEQHMAQRMAKVLKKTLGLSRVQTVRRTTK